jgi:hypothetical protein
MIIRRHKRRISCVLRSKRAAYFGDESWPAGALFGEAVAAGFVSPLAGQGVAVHGEKDHHGGCAEAFRTRVTA